jgi:hypothetical protein
VGDYGTGKSPETRAVDGYARPSGREAGIWRWWKRRRREWRGLLGLRGGARVVRESRDVRRYTRSFYHDVDGSVGVGFRPMGLCWPSDLSTGYLFLFFERTGYL